MVVDLQKPTREQISRLVNGDQRMISALEALFDRAVTTTPDDIALLRGQVLQLVSGIGSDGTAGQSVDYLDFLGGPHVTLPRRMQWNADDGTVDVGLSGSVVLQVGQELHYYAKNTSGVTIPNGAGVMATGTIGASAKLTIAKAVADGSIEGRYMIGVATEDIANNAFGYVTSFGLVRGLDTSAWSDGDLLYFDPSTAGSLTNTQPSAPNLKTAQAIVVHSGLGGSGSIFVRMTEDHGLQELNDVQLTGLSDGDLLQWDGAAGYWKPYTIPTGASGSFTAASGETITVVNGLITGIV
jgi:hypothetical protein